MSCHEADYNGLTSQDPDFGQIISTQSLHATEGITYCRPANVLIYDAMYERSALSIVHPYAGIRGDLFTLLPPPLIVRTICASLSAAI